VLVLSIVLLTVAVVADGAIVARKIGKGLEMSETITSIDREGNRYRVACRLLHSEPTASTLRHPRRRDRPRPLWQRPTAHAVA
jgi:hypothetical protein